MIYLKTKSNGNNNRYYIVYNMTKIHFHFYKMNLMDLSGFHSFIVSNSEINVLLQIDKKAISAEYKWYNYCKQLIIHK